MLHRVCIIKILTLTSSDCKSVKRKSKSLMKEKVIRQSGTSVYTSWVHVVSTQEDVDTTTLWMWLTCHTEGNKNFLTSKTNRKIHLRNRNIWQKPNLFAYSLGTTFRFKKEKTKSWISDSMSKPLCILE